MLVYLSRLLIVVFFVFASIFTASADTEVKIQRITDRLYYVPDAKAKTIDFQMIVNAGCYDEANNNCLGLAHYLEHIILIGRNSGSTDIAFRFFPDAYANGWTNNQATAYVHKVPLKGGAPEPILEKLFDFYAKRLTGFDISAKDAERERQIVQQEYDWRYASKPESLFLLEAAALEIPQNPHNQTAAGTPASIAALTIDQAKKFHERWYSKDNVNFVVTGNIDAEKLKTIVANALKDTQSRPVPSHDWQKVPSYKNETIIKRGKDKQTARTKVYMSKIIRLDDSDEYKTQAVQSILYGFLASKLTQSPYSVLVERELLASDVSVSIHKRIPGIYEFDIVATLADNVPQAKLIEAITRYTNQLSKLQLNETTLQRLKKRYADNWKESLGNADQVTSRLVGWLARDLKYDELAKLPDRVTTVSLSDIATQTQAISAEGRVIFAVLEPDLTPVAEPKKGAK